MKYLEKKTYAQILVSGEGIHVRNRIITRLRIIKTGLNIIVWTARGCYVQSSLWKTLEGYGRQEFTFSFPEDDLCSTDNIDMKLCLWKEVVEIKWHAQCPHLWHREFCSNSHFHTVLSRKITPCSSGVPVVKLHL